MLSRKNRNWQSESLRKLTSLLLLVSLCMAVLPIPVFLPVAKDRSQPFPCQDRPCGCRTADQCRQRCCCFTKDQKIAWAKQRGLPAEQVVDDADRSVAESPRSTSSQQTCCETKDSGAAATCCTTDHKNRMSCHSQAPQRPAPQQVRKFVIGLFAEQCQSGATEWNSLPWSVPPEPACSWKPLFTLSAVSHVLSDLRDERYERPPVPPPRA